MSEWWTIGIAALALVISVISLIFNWRHSESIVRRTQYPAVAWHRPILSKGDKSTAVSATLCNHGPTEITAIWLGAFLSNRFRTKAWCKSESITTSPINEELKLVITDTLEEDITERFSGLYFDESWHCEGRPHSYKAVFQYEYQPLMADTSPIIRKNYYLLKPIVEDGIITSWEIIPISRLRSLLPTF